jgi:hydrogenase-4 component F
MTTTMLAVPLLAPLTAALLVAAVGWRRVTAAATMLAALAVIACGVLVMARTAGGASYAAGRLLRGDAVAGVLLLVIGSVTALAAWASIDYLDAELAEGQTTPARARLYGALVNAFVASMVLVVLANNLGVVWVAIEATTVSTAFLVGHRRTRESLEATWKYVVICSVGITLAFLGTVLLYFASLHVSPGAHALDLDVLQARAALLDPGVTKLAAGLLLLGFGTKVGLAPFHTWLADAHSQAPAPVSALMSGVLLSVAFSVLLRIKTVVDITLGTTYLRVGLLTLGLLTLLVAAALLVAQRDYKRMLAYSSLEHMGLIAVAAAAGTKLALAALLLLVLAHGLGKSVLFLVAGHLQHGHRSTAIADVRGVLDRSPLLGGLFAVGLIALLGFPPFALFASEIGVARGMTAAHLGWALAAAFAFVLIAFTALARHGAGMLLGAAPADAPRLHVSVAAAGPLVIGLVLCLALGVTAGPLTDVLTRAATLLGGSA